MDWKPRKEWKEARLPDAADAEMPFPNLPEPTVDEAALVQAKRSYRRIGWFAFLLFLISQLTAAGILLLLEQLHVSLDGRTWLLNLVSTVPLYVVALPLCWLMIRKLPRSVPTPDVLPLRGLGSLFLICLFLTYACNILGSMLMTVIQTITGTTAVNAVDALLEDISIWETVLFMVILAPLGEELIFRKLILDRLRDYGEKSAILISALIFGLFHGNLTQFPYAFVLGWVFGYVYLRTGRLRNTILLHMAVNTVGGLLPVAVLYPLAEKLDGISGELTMDALMGLPEAELMELGGAAFGVGLYAMLLVGGCIAGLVLLLRHRKEIYFLSAEKEIPKARRFRTTCVHGGLVLLVLAFVAVSITFFLP